MTAEVFGIFRMNDFDVVDSADYSGSFGNEYKIGNYIYSRPNLRQKNLRLTTDLTPPNVLSYPYSPSVLDYPYRSIAFEEKSVKKTAFNIVFYTINSATQNNPYRPSVGIVSNYKLNVYLPTSRNQEITIYGSLGNYVYEIIDVNYENNKWYNMSVFMWYEYVNNAIRIVVYFDGILFANYRINNIKDLSVINKVIFPYERSFIDNFRMYPISQKRINMFNSLEVITI